MIQHKYFFGPRVLEGFIERVAGFLSIDQAVDNPIHKFPLIPYGERLIILSELDQSSTEFSRLQNNLALVYQDLGRYDQAAKLLEQALQATINNFGPKHPKVADIQLNLAAIYRDLGLYKTATELLEQALQSNLSNFGLDHPKVALSQWHLAVVYTSISRKSDAITLLKMALRTYEKRLGIEHPHTENVKSWLEAYE